MEGILGARALVRQNPVVALQRDLAVILDDQHRFAFVHIPKCAGSSVKLANPSLFQGAKFSRPVEGTRLGTLPWPLCTHLPLAVLADALPEDFEKLRQYESFTVVRDPVDRFVSAVMQHEREFGDGSSASFVGQRFFDLCQRRIDGLPAMALTDPRSCHFFRQVDYVYLGGEQVVQHIDLPGSFTALNRFLGAHGFCPVADSEKVNSSVRPKSALFAAAVRHGKRVRQWMPRELKVALWKTLIQLGFYTDNSSQQLSQRIRETSRLFGALQEFYREDFALVSSVEAEQRGAPGQGATDANHEMPLEKRPR